MDNELRGLVLSKYRSIKSFSETIGWDRKKASRIVNRIQNPLVDDIYKMVKLLDVKDPAEVTRIFLPGTHTMWE